jgi:phosphohistidine swiveling domain-containing protein
MKFALSDTMNAAESVPLQSCDDRGSYGSCIQSDINAILDSAAPLVLPLSAVNRLMVKSVGGKAANLGEMLQAGFPVPDGFVVTAQAYQNFLNSALMKDGTKERLKPLIDQLETLGDTENLAIVRDLGANLRKALDEVPIPHDVVDSIKLQWKDLEVAHKISHEDFPLCVAVRSSATAEDLPNASFAGQYDTYLNISGYESLLRHIKCCWISLFTDRAISYRLKQKFPSWKCSLCVVVQIQINPVVSGIMFTADVVTGLRNVTVIDAGFGLGEALVSGLINPDVYKYDRKRNVLEKKIGIQDIEVIPTLGQLDKSEEYNIEGTKTVEVEKSRRDIQKLTDGQIGTLVSIGTGVQSHYNGAAQDIEWCVERVTGKMYIVQSRPITTLFPLPEGASDDADFKVYVSFGHIQVMMDPVSPCGVSVLKHFMPIGRDPVTRTSPLIVGAGCYMYVNVTRVLQNHFGRKIYLFAMRNAMKNIAVSIDYVMANDDFKSLRPGEISVIFIFRFLSFVVPKLFLILWVILFMPSLENVPSLKSAFIDTYMAKVRSRIRYLVDPEQKLKEALQVLEGLYEGVFLHIAPYLFAGFLSMGLLRKLMHSHVDQDKLDAIERGLSGNVTTEMNLRIGDLSDVTRQEPKVMDWLKSGNDLTMNGLNSLNNSDSVKFREALKEFLECYGSRANSEIDISRPRWRDDPSSIFQVIRGNLTNEEAGYHRKHHQNLMAQGTEAAKQIIKSAPWYKRFLVRRLIRVARALMALREHPKFLLIQTLGEIRQVVLEISSIQVSKGSFDSEDDVWFLTLDEVIESLNWTKDEAHSVISYRRSLKEIYSKFKPPLVLTSEGECVNIHPNNGCIPSGALPGLGVSSGVAVGIAKVVTDPTSVVLHSGEILVAQCTDPGWTPLFINAAGVVMEVGGYLTHGSVVSREYNLPAVACVANATSKIKTGMKLRVDGTRGFVEIIAGNGDLVE